MQIDCIIIEDEPLAQERLKGYIQKRSWLRLLAVFDNGIEALSFLQTRPVDLIFLDINMGDFSGIQLLESIRPEGQVVISTAYHEYALKGFELNVTDYLLKPYTFERWLQAVDKVRGNKVKAASNPAPNFIFVKTEYRLEKLQLDELLYIEGMRDYRRIFTLTKQILTLETFGELEQRLPPGVACRVHKSFMVALDKIDSVERDLIRLGKTEIHVSETYRKQFMQLLNR
jgi:two-component system, LytTR family, response regulator